MKKTFLFGTIIAGALIGLGVGSFLYAKKEVDKILKDLENSN